MTERKISAGSAADKLSEKAETTYNRLLDRINDAIEQVEEKTWAGIKYDIEQAVELEAAAEEMTREEVALLAAYVKKDLKHLTHYLEETGKGVADWLKFDTQLVENRILDLLLSIADKTTIAQKEFELGLKKASSSYVVGDYVMPGTFACIACGEINVFAKPQILLPCSKCEGSGFRRITSSDENDQ